jgi:DNA anti-recombination protein RmuC
MHPDLERIVSADEEARTRVALAEQRHDVELTAARSERDAAIDARRKEAGDALEHELRAIFEDGDRRAGELQRQQMQYLAALTGAGERKFEEAVELYLRIVCEVAS